MPNNFLGEATLTKSAFKRDAIALSLAVFCIQYGFGVFISVPMLLMVFLLMAAKYDWEDLTPALAIIALLFAVLWNSIIGDADKINWLREIRLSLQLAFLLALQRGCYSKKIHDSLARVPWVHLAIVMVVFALVQVLGKALGINLFMPDYLFMTNDDGALGYAWFLHAAEHGLEFEYRPSAFYSEPSYLGLVLLFLHCMVLMLGSGRSKLAISGLAILGSILASSGLGILGNLLIAIWFHARAAFVPFLIGAVAILFLAILAGADFGLGGRLENIVGGNDESANIRLLQPLAIIFDVLIFHPFGIPLSAAVPYYQKLGVIAYEGDIPFQNGLFNIIISYGWLGVVVIFSLVRNGGNYIAKIFIIIALMQNGGYSEVDKVVLISVVSLVAANFVSNDKLRRDKWLAA